MHKVPIDYTSIFVGQLDYKADEQSIRERFGRYGTIVGVQVLSKQNLIGRRPSDGASGFAFVKYDGRESATKAVKSEVNRIATIIMEYV
jgi:RNA recognition motif-containing protein